MKTIGSNQTRLKISRRTALAGMSAGVAMLAMPRLGRAAEEAIRIGFPTP